MTSNTPPRSAIRVQERDVQIKKLEKIAETPGEWALLNTYPTKLSARQVVYNLRGGKRVLPPGVWEFAYGPEDEDDPDTEYGVWVRLIQRQEK